MVFPAVVRATIINHFLALPDIARIARLPDYAATPLLIVVSSKQRKINIAPSQRGTILGNSAAIYNKKYKKNNKKIIESMCNYLLFFKYFVLLLYI